MYDKYDENLDQIGFGREERVFGGFFQYTGIFGDMFTAMAGVRFDHHNLYGSFFTPRLHLKFSPDENTSVRASAGMGYRSANVIAENNIYLGSSREVWVNGNKFTDAIQMERSGYGRSLELWNKR